MGGGSYSRDYYEERERIRAETNAPVFTHDADIASGKVTAGVHELLDPKNFRNGVREARDSAEHPNSVPIIFGLDVTGSMRRVPGIVHANMPKLMTTILTGGFLADPQVCFAAIGDSHTDQGPLQVGQFESGNVMEDDLGRFWLEGGGGGTYEEGYEMLLYYAVRHTATDAWEKRKRKGYIFMTGDEKAYSTCSPAIIHRIFGGERPSEGVSLQAIVKEAQERYHVFFIIPSGTNHASDPELFEYWANLLGRDHVLRLEDVNQICDLVAITIGITEGTAKTAALETLNPAVKAAIDPVLASTKEAVAKTKKAGGKTARL
jgi:hypothetical protein